VFLRDYELMFIATPELNEEQLNATMAKVSQFIATGGGEVVKTDVWGKRKLAYPIKAFREGQYVVVQCKLDPKQADEVERSLRLSEEIIRHLLIRLSEE